MKNNKLLFILLFILIFLLVILSFSLINFNNNKQKSKIETKTEESKQDTIIEKEIYLNYDIKNKTSIYYKKDSFNFNFEENNEDFIFEHFIDNKTWGNLNFSKSDSILISKSFNENPIKTKNIIYLMTKYDKELKLDLIPIENGIDIFYSIDSLDANDNINKVATKKSNNNNIKQMNISIYYKDKNISLDYALLKDGFSEYVLKDDLNQRYLYGDDIQDLIDKKILILNFPYTRDLAIEESLNALDLKPNYTSFEIHIKYNDGRNFNYNIKK